MDTYDCFPNDPNNWFLPYVWDCNVTNIGSTSVDVDDGSGGSAGVYPILWMVSWTHAGITDSSGYVLLPYTINGLSPLTSYTVKMHPANNLCDNSTQTTNITTLASCPPPSGLTLSSTCAKILHISWNGNSSPQYQVSIHRLAPTPSGWTTKSNRCNILRLYWATRGHL